MYVFEFLIDAELLYSHIAHNGTSKYSLSVGENDLPKKNAFGNH